jgi:hypothetical protein
MDDELATRIRRLYAAIDAVEEKNPGTLRGTVVRTATVVRVTQDFRSGRSDEELLNLAYSVINNITNLRAHLRKWADRNGLEKKKVDTAVHNSSALQIIIDLSNRDKHPYPPRDGGLSGKSPELASIDSVLRMTTSPRRNGRGHAGRLQLKTVAWTTFSSYCVRALTTQSSPGVIASKSATMRHRVCSVRDRKRPMASQCDPQWPAFADWPVASTCALPLTAHNWVHFVQFAAASSTALRSGNLPMNS